MKTIRADQRVGLLLAGVVLSTFVSIGATVALPASDPSLDVKPRELSKQEAKGMEIFKREGLWYCDASYIRQTSVDSASSSEATKPADVAGMSPVMLGLERAGAPGPGGDESRACGVRLSDADSQAVQAFLETRTGK